METQGAPAGRRQSVGRGQKMRRAVLAATLAELAEQGYAGLTVDNVARRAGVHKTTIYRHWQDRERLVVDALTEHVAAEIPIPDTGLIETDLRALARALVRWLNSLAGRAVMAAFFSDVVHVPEIADARRRVFDDRLRRAEPVVGRAIARGELPPDTDPALVIKALAAPVYFRLLITGEQLDDAVAEHAVQVALAAAGAGALRGGAAAGPEPEPRP